MSGEVENLRLFVAVRIPEDRLARLDEQVSPLRSSLAAARWIPASNQHVTLKFLGRTTSDRLEAIERVVATTAAGHEGSRCALAQIGAFPSMRRARVLWVGVTDEACLLQRVAGDLSRAFEALGFPQEARPFTPHLTLARFKAPQRLGDLPVLSEQAPFVVAHLELMRSRLHPKGARYETVRSFEIGAPRRGA